MGKEWYKGRECVCKTHKLFIYSAVIDINPYKKCDHLLTFMFTCNLAVLAV